MSYFNYLPNVGYSVSPSSFSPAKNIMVRAKIKDSIGETQKTFLDYLIRDGEKPETLAYRVYGRSDYHWIVLMFNEIHDVYNQWPMSSNELDVMLERAYPGKVLYIDSTMMKLRDKDGFYLDFDRRNPHFEEGTIIEQVEFSPDWKPGPWSVTNPLPQPTEVVARGLVKSWDPNLYKLVVEPINGVFSLSGVAFQTSGREYRDVDRRELSPNIRFTNSKGQTVYVPLVRITEDNKYSLHHFENEQGRVLSPLLKMNIRRNNQLYSSYLIDSYAVGNAEVFDTEEYGLVSIVTNIQYETMQNEAKRKIKMMRPEYIDILIKEMRILTGRS